MGNAEFTALVQSDSRPARARQSHVSAKGTVGAIGALFLITILPLQWQSLARTGSAGYIRYFDVVGVMLCLIVSFRLRELVHTLSPVRVFAIGAAYWLAFYWAASFLHGFAISIPARPTVYALIGLAAAHALAPGNEVDARRLRWVGVTALGLFLLVFTKSSLASGANPVQLIIQAIATHNGNIIQYRLFREAFIGSGYNVETVRSNLRHEVFGALLVAGYTSIYYAIRAPIRGTIRRVVWNGALVGIFVLVALSLSRSVILAATLGGALALLRPIVRDRLSARFVFAVWFGFVAVAVGVATGIVSLVWSHFLDTTSYVSRAEGLSSALQSFLASPVVGQSSRTIDITAHNLVFDSAANGGLFLAVPACVMLAATAGGVAVLFFRSVRRDNMLDLVAACTLVLPLVRMVTSGGGTLYVTQWVALGFVGAHLAQRRRVSVPSQIGRQDRSTRFLVSSSRHFGV